FQSEEGIKSDVSEIGSTNGSRLSAGAASFVLAAVGVCLCTSLFASGFLLSRTELHNRSACREATAGFAGRGDLRDGCWLPRRFDRVMLLLVDALRFDFLRPNRSLANRHYWAGNVLAVDELQQSRPRHAFVAHVEADAPTTTLQRLKALLTGTLPTFIDASANFGGAALREDNLIDQLLGGAANRTAVFMGDDTWLSLLPGRFQRAYPFPSFSIHDLDTVDRGVERHLAEELQRTDWQLLVAHVLGVDHCGHRYGPEHPEMRRKLREVDALIRAMLQRMDNRTLLVVLGDHGMTTGGDHGGGSEDEIDAGVALVSNSRPLLGPEDALALRQQPPRLSQIDLVPTLALLLGAPIPFSSLGAVPPALFASPGDRGARARDALTVNARQVMRFLETYQAAYADLPAARLAKLRADAAAAIGSDVEGMRRLLDDVKDACRSVWARFDEPAIGLALTAFAVCLAFGGAFFAGPDGGKGRLAAGFAVAIAACAAAFAGRAALPPALVWGLPASALLGGAASLAARLLAASAAEAPPPDTGARLSQVTSFACALTAGFASLSPLSNSFIISEPSCLLYLLQTLLLLQAAATCVAALRRARADGLWRKPCKSLIGHPRPAALAVSPPCCLACWRCSPSLAAFRWWLRRCGNFNGYSPAVLALSYLPVPIGLCAIIHWVLQAAGSPASPLLLRIGLALATAGVFILLLAPSTAHLERRPATSRRLQAIADALARGYDLAEVAPALCRDLLGDSGEDSDNQHRGYGMRFMYRTAACGLLLFACLAVLLLAGHRAVPALLLCAAAAALHAELRSAQLRLGQGRPLAELAGWPDIVFLLLLGWAAFYACGLQPSLSAIRWDPAFIAYSAETSGSAGRFFGGVLILSGMFWGQLLAAMAAPLLLLLLPLTAGHLPFVARPKWRRLLPDQSSGDFLLTDLPPGTLAGAAAGVFARLLLLAACLALGSMAAAGWHRRHLMAWKVFAPRMMFGVIGCAATAVGAGAGLLCA
uniref:GPI ethanolamine phosphate transferase 3 n=1 Tax=Macrostomum lignano TaxID=282301 RepID=A0A1I8HVW0_9PLAT